MKQERKRTKIGLQIGIIVVPVFLLVLAATTVIMYNSAIDGFLEAQNTRMEEMLANPAENVVAQYFNKLFDFFEAHPEEVVTPITEEEEKVYTEAVNIGYAFGIDENWFVDQPDMVKMCVAKKLYFELVYNMLYYMSKDDYDCLFLIDPDNETVLFEAEREDLPPHDVLFGEDYEKNVRSHAEIRKEDLKLSKLAAVRNILSGEEGVQFENRSPLHNSKYYTAFTPIVLGGRIRAVLGISYNWTEFSNNTIKRMAVPLLIGVVGILLLMLLLLFVIRKKIVSPVLEIEQGLADYTKTKDSAAVQARMNRIRTGNETEDLSEYVSELAGEIDTYTAENIRLAAEKERVSAELSLATQIQSDMLPNIFPAFPDRPEFDIYASMDPAKEVGGDFYDFFLVDDDHLYMTIADVSDKGVPAALFMMYSMIVLADNARMGKDPAAILTDANRIICENNRHDMFVTVWTGILEISTGRLTAACAGHEYPAVTSASGRFELYKDPRDCPVGSFDDVVYRNYELTLKPGDKLFVYTDGLAEAADAKRSMFGLDRMIDALNKDPRPSPEEILAAVRKQVDEFVGGAVQFDDLTMMCLEYRGKT